ncbi:MAG TPA: alginate export family protein [Gemmataceae bacterium]|nr:alginate export family protein [Gemmataceae bacterium]
MRGGNPFPQMGVLAGFSLALVLEFPVLSWAQDVSKPQSPIIRSLTQKSQPAAPLPISAPPVGDQTNTAASVESTAEPSTDLDHSPSGFLLGPNFGRDWEPSNWTKVPSIPVLPRAGWFIIPPTGPGYYSLKDWITGDYRDNPPKYPYPPTSIDPYTFYDADYRFLDDPNNTQFDWSDFYKRIHMGDNWMLSIGGEERVRYQHEEGGYLRLFNGDNDYTLLRSRVYMDLWYQDMFRVYAEFYDARVNGQDLPPNPTDVNHSDFLNLFAELKIFELADHPAYLRVGRQELLLGSQRLISPLDWANTRRTFQGVRGYWHGECWDVDAFWVHPVVVNPTNFDSPDYGREFMGVWTTYRPKKGTSVDAYFLHLDNSRPANSLPLGGRGGALGGYSVNTIGSRFTGDQNHFLWDFEGMYQFGEWVNEGDAAGAVTTSVGYQFADVLMDPQFWLAWDYASGTFDPARAAQHGTFNQLFPFGHYYFGFLDLVGRQNISDLNMQFDFFPAKWIVTVLQYHMFRLDSAKDALYNAGGTAIRRDPTGRAGTDVGDEIDLVTNFHLSQHQDILLGYSKLFAGQFIQHSTGPKGSPEFFYAQYCFKW